MAKFTRFDSRNKKKGKHKSYSREEKDFRIKNPEIKKVKIARCKMQNPIFVVHQSDGQN